MMFAGMLRYRLTSEVRHLVLASFPTSTDADSDHADLRFVDEIGRLHSLSAWAERSLYCRVYSD